MPSPRRDASPASRRLLAAFAAVVVVIAATTAMAAAHATKKSVKSKSSGPAVVEAAHNAALGTTILTDAKGRTLYVLSGETTHHLMCASAICLKFWPLATVPSPKTKLVAGKGAKGKLGLLKRTGGVEQLTLNGEPLYRFAGDTSTGDASGEGVVSFGGTWLALGASGKVVPAKPKPTTSSTSTSTSDAPTSSAPAASSTATSSAAAPTSTAAATTTATSTSSSSSTTGGGYGY